MDYDKKIVDYRMRKLNEEMDKLRGKVFKLETSPTDGFSKLIKT